MALEAPVEMAWRSCCASACPRPRASAAAGTVCIALVVCVLVKIVVYIACARDPPVLEMFKSEIQRAQTPS
jgi:hypothetical protein